LTKNLFSSFRKGTIDAFNGGGGMKNTVSALMLVLALYILPVAGAHLVEADSQLVSPVLSNVNIVSPSNSTYNSSLLTLNANVTALGGSNIHTSMSYSLDGACNQTMPLTIEYPAGNSFTMALHVGGVDLPPLSEGSHNITVYVACEYPNNDRFANEPETITASYNSTVYFTVNTSAEQQIPEFQSWIILPLLITAALVVIICKKRLG
jgi:hypothetical protein